MRAGTKKKLTIEEQIVAAEAALKNQQAKLEVLRAKLKGEGVLKKDSPGMEALYAAMDAVCKENKCNNIDVVKAINRLKRLGLEIVQKERNQRGEPKAKKPVTEFMSEG
ncbi:hypothetical protein [Thauera humireducens]|uniref:Uncharacterized protein n=1 Tax=Thauera humireducens TaxID=1134435 RepID=A0A127K5T9_9RHOO|nr:hypothetical protein [Thauera humireducens]AMO37315.1 hypothetical protein AC731_010330 [Thauera humireducens]